MTTFVLIHGSSADSHYWYRVTPLLEKAGHQVIAPDLPAGDDSADFDDYAAAVIDAVGDQSSGVVIVGQSMGAFVAPIVATKVPTELIVLLAPMIPVSGETPGSWWGDTGQPEAVRKYAEQNGFDPEFNPVTIFFHDVPKDVTDELMKAGEPTQSEAIFGRKFPLDAWPAVPTRVIACANDRMFPLPLQERLSEERLGVQPDVIESGHLAAFGHPDLVAQKLEEYVSELG
ncbi:MAG: alpha/beta hydrolase [Pseudonocardia sp.]|nr:alpha/beta hydrolase [Pseudonocardia sp.]